MTELQQADLFESFEETPQAVLLTPDEVFDRLDETLLAELAEDRRLERKPASYSGDKLGEYISMWANSAPHGGIIVIGVSNDGTFEGLASRGDSGLNKIEKCGNTFCPEADVHTRRIAVTNKNGDRDFVVAMRVHYHKSRVVKTVTGAAFIRSGDEKHRMKSEEVRQLQADKQEISFETEPCRLSYPSDFDLAAVRTFAGRVRAARELNGHPDEDVLELLNLGRRVGNGFQPNIACALLFARTPRRIVPGCRIRFLRFDGEQEGTGEKWNAVKDAMIEGQVPDIIAAADELIQSQVRTFSTLDPNKRFTPQPEYPRTAWYEALVNACVHRSYGNGLKNTDVFVKMFDNRLVIESPGPFPPFVTPENIYDSHVPRNPFLMDAMRYMDMVRCAHEGTRRMRASMAAMNLPDPEFEQKQISYHLVRVTLRNNVHQRKAWVDTDVTELIGAMLAKSLSEEHKRLLNFVAEHDAISVSDATRLINVGWATAKKRLMELVEMGILWHDKRDDPTLDRDTKARFRLKR